MTYFFLFLLFSLPSLSILSWIHEKRKGETKRPLVTIVETSKREYSFVEQILQSTHYTSLLDNRVRIKWRKQTETAQIERHAIAAFGE